MHQPGEPEDALVLEEVDDPTPGPGEVAIAVRAWALNFPDLLMVQGRYQVKPPTPFTPGIEVCGVVTAAGDGAGIEPGTRVVAHPDHGGMAEIVVTTAERTFPIPDEIDDVTGAALTITYQTGWFGLLRQARLQPDETLLVHAGAGGVGSAAIQIGKAAGARVIATAGGPAKVAVCEQLGADVAIDYTADDFLGAVQEATGSSRGVDVIYDPVGGDTFDASRRCLAFEGRLVTVGFTSGRIPDAPANHILLKNYSVVGVHLDQYYEWAPKAVQDCHDDLVRLHAEGRIEPLVAHRLPFDEAPAALTSLGRRSTTGKVVLTG